jgi:membrane protease YdiL (CAAX protease family)
LDLVLQLVVLVVVIAAAAGLAFWAQRAQHDRSALVGLYLLFGLPGFLLFVAGLAAAVNGERWGWVLLAIGLGLSLPLLRPVRVALSKILPIDPGSPNDMTGLAIVLATIAALSFTLAESSPSDSGTITTTGLITNLLAEFALAYVIVGYRIYRNGAEATRRLGLRWPTWITIPVALGFLVACFASNFLAAFLTFLFQPDLFDTLQESIPEMTGDMQNPLGAAMVGLSAGIGEELLLRGAIQPRMGIVLTSVLFALLHTQYGLSFVNLGVFGIGVLLGLERKYFGTTAAVITHATYNFTAVMLQSLS